jgi:hypothetical protein
VPASAEIARSQGVIVLLSTVLLPVAAGGLVVGIAGALTLGRLV